MANNFSKPANQASSKALRKLRASSVDHRNGEINKSTTNWPPVDVTKLKVFFYATLRSLLRKSA